MVATRALQAQRLAALRRDIAGHDQRAFPPVDLHPEAAAGPGGGGDMGRSHRATRQLSADQHVVRRGDLHQLLRVGPYHCRAWVVTTHATRAKWPTTKRKASIT